MANVNKVIIVGRLGRDPDIKYTQQNTPVANMSVATEESWKDRSTGEWQSKTEWHRVVAWQYLAEKIEKNLRKGMEVYVEGKLETRKWTDQQGNDKYTTEIIARDVQPLGVRSEPAHKEGGGEFNPGPLADPAPDELEDSLPF